MITCAPKPHGGVLMQAWSTSSTTTGCVHRDVGHHGRHRDDADQEYSEKTHRLDLQVARSG
jgi:hypothetical protein